MDDPTIDQAGTWASELAAEQSALEDAKERHDAAVNSIYMEIRLRLAEARSDDPQRASELARQIYWDLPEIPVRIIEDGLGLKRNGMHEIAGLGPVIAICLDCSKQIRAKSRTQAGMSPGGFTPRRCDPCREVKDRRVSEEWEAREAACDGFDTHYGGSSCPCFCELIAHA